LGSFYQKAAFLDHSAHKPNQIDTNSCHTYRKIQKINSSLSKES